MKLNIKLTQLNTLLNKIYALADNNLLVSNAETGLNDYSISEKYSKKLESASKLVASFANRLSEQAAVIMDKVDKAHDMKRNKQDVLFAEEVTNPKLKCPETRKHNRIKFIPSTDTSVFRIKRECISDDEEDKVADEPVSSELDGRFMYPKINKNPAESHKFHCDHCNNVFHDQNKLRNHYTNHRIEFFTCFACDMLLCSMRSFEDHQKSHTSEYKCEICSKSFLLKTSFINHAQVHSNEVMHCSKEGCNRTFKHQQNHLEHIRWGHRKNKECPCNVCGKMFQTPTNMRAHRVKIHGFMEELLPGHPHAEVARKRRLAKAAAKKAHAEEVKKQKLTAKSNSAEATLKSTGTDDDNNDSSERDE